MITLVAWLLLGSVAAIPPEFARNVTVYHVFPSQFEGPPVNMNTADIYGDMYFDLRGVSVPLECAHPTSSSAHDCDNPEVIDPNLVIAEIVLEVDSRFGSYGVSFSSQTG